MRRTFLFALLLGAGVAMGWHTTADAAPELTQLAQAQPAPMGEPAAASAPAKHKKHHKGAHKHKKHHKAAGAASGASN